MLAVCRVILGSVFYVTQLFLQLLCIVVVVVGRIVNIMVPFVFAELVHLFEEGSYTNVLWLYLFAYVGLRFLQGSGGLAALREVRISNWIFSTRF